LPLLISAHARDIYVEAGDLHGKLERASALVTCTQANVDYLRSRYPDFAQKIHLIYHGLPVDWLATPPPSPARDSATPLAIIAAGRFVRKKGFSTLLEACARLRFPWSLTIIGDGELRAELLHRRDSLGLIQQITFPGWLDENALRAAFATADICCCPSIIDVDGDRDGLPNVLIEAQASGLAVIGSNISGIPEAIRDGETGLLVPANDTTALTDAITHLNDTQYRKKLATNASAFVRVHFSGSRGLDKLENLLINAM
jgi:glycosyltransferase involved in cell wall biosynthesis